MLRTSSSRERDAARGIFLGLLAILLPAGAASGQAGTETTRIDIEGPRFPAEPIEVWVGDTVTWHNLDIVPHTVTVDGADGGIDWTSDAIDSASAFSHVFTKATRVEYRCAYHPSMTGVLEVRERRSGG